jgi:isopentenyl phosphate kinase
VLPDDTALQIQHLVDAGFVPLLFGDVVFVPEAGVLVALSSDIIAARIAKSLKPHACIFIGDTALWTADPKTNADAKHVALIRGKQWRAIDG